MMVNRLKKKLHKLKDPQMHFPFDGVGVKPQYEVKIFGTKENNLLFYVDDKGSRSQAYSRGAVLIDGEWRFPHYGDYYCWYPNGEIKGLVRTSKGKQHGEQIGWYPDGSFKKIGNWHYGDFHGRWTEWYENGVTSFQGHFRHGKKHGKWWEWYENGKMSVSAEFLDGYTLELKVWKPDGTLCPESGVSSGFGYWISYEDNGKIKDRSEISNGEIDYELPDDEGDDEY